MESTEIRARDKALLGAWNNIYIEKVRAYGALEIVGLNVLKH
jgi:hypothetical protein